MSEQRPTYDDKTRRQRRVDPRSQPERPTPDAPPTRRTVRTPRPARVPPSQEPPPPPPPPADVRSPGLSVPWWGFVIVILAVAAITCGMWWLVLASRGGGVSEYRPSATPIFVVITATPTLGPAGSDGAGAVTPLAPTETPTEPALPTEVSPSVEVIPIQVGSQVIVDGTEGAGLAVRQGPGVDFTFFFVANDGDQFAVEDGPREGDGYTWWYIVDPADQDRAGWAVETYMTVIQQP